MKLSLDERLKIAKLHIYEDVPITQLAKDFGADTGRVKFYVSLYKMWGKKAFKKGATKSCLFETIKA